MEIPGLRWESREYTIRRFPLAIVPFNHQKWPYLFLGFCSVKLIEINMKVSTYHALYALLKSSFYLLSIGNSAENKLIFLHFSRIFMMVPHTFFFLSSFFLALDKKVKDF
jgi:hypothetical protein